MKTSFSPRSRPLLLPGAGSRGQFVAGERAEEKPPPVARRLQSLQGEHQPTNHPNHRLPEAGFPNPCAQVYQPRCSLPLVSAKFTAEELQFYAEKALFHLNHHAKCRMKVAEVFYHIICGTPGRFF